MRSVKDALEVLAEALGLYYAMLRMLAVSRLRRLVAKLALRIETKIGMIGTLVP